MKRSSLNLLTAFILLAVIIPLLINSGTYFVHFATLILIYGIAATGLNMLSGYAGQISLGHAAFMAIGAYSTAIICMRLKGIPFWESSGLHTWVGMFIGTLFAAVLSAIIARPALRLKGPYLGMMTIAFAWVIWKILIEWVDFTGGDLGISAIPRVQIGTHVFYDKGFFILVFLFFLSVLFLQNQIVKSYLGLAIRGIKQDETVVASVGINPSKIKIKVFVISATIAGFAGTLFAFHQSYINPDSFQVFDSVLILFAVLLGGAGTRFGPVLGVFILFVLPEQLQSLADYRMIVNGILILITLYFLPKGIIGELQNIIINQSDSSQIEREAFLFSKLETLKVRSGVRLLIKDVAKSFEGLSALENVNLDIKPGTIHSLIGPNGAGKTTLINLITGMLPLDNGQLYVNDKQLYCSGLDGAVRSGLARTFQSPRVLKEMTVLENVIIGYTKKSDLSIFRSIFYSRRDWTNRLKATRDLLAHFGLKSYENITAEKLPQGLLRQLELVRAISSRPSILLLDEPVAGLTEMETQNLFRLLKELKNCGFAILLVEHNIDFVIKISDSITVLNNGKVIACGTPEEISSNNIVKAAYLG